jgi:hypothetical protein
MWKCPSLDDYAKYNSSCIALSIIWIVQKPSRRLHGCLKCLYRLQNVVRVGSFITVSDLSSKDTMKTLRNPCFLLLDTKKSRRICSGSTGLPRHVIPACYVNWNLELNTYILQFNIWNEATLMILWIRKTIEL